MSDTTSDGDKTIRVERRRTISLKRDTDTVRQSFSGGRSKSVVVEKKRRRISLPGSNDAAPVSKPPEPAAKPVAEATKPAADVAAAEKASRGSGVVLRTLTEDERGARAQALADAKVREAVDRQHAEEEARRHAEDEVKLARERDEAAARPQNAPYLSHHPLEVECVVQGVAVHGVHGAVREDQGVEEGRQINLARKLTAEIRAAADKRLAKGG